MPVSLPAGVSSLPPLGGRLFGFYRIAWWALAAIAIVTLVLSLTDAHTPVGIAGIRTVKAIVLIAVSAILYRRRRKDPVAAMLGLAFLLWTISSSVDFLTSATVPAVIDRIRFLFFALALLLFPNGEWWPRWTLPIAMVIVATFLVGLAEAVGLLATSLFLPIAIGCVLAALLSLMRRFRAVEPGVQKQQLKWVVLGLVSGVSLILSARAGAALTSGMAILPVGRIALETMFQLGIVLVALGFLTSLLRYRLYDAETAISRSAVYAALTMALVGTFATSEVLFEILGERIFGMAIGNVSSAIAAGLAAVLLTPLHHRISNWAEQYFQHDLATLKTELPDLLSVLSVGASVRRLAGSVLPKIEQAVHSTRLALVVDGRLAAAHGTDLASARRMLRGWMPPDEVDVLDRAEEHAYPLRIALRCPLGNIRAWLLFGPRPDGSFYGQDDLEALGEIVPPLQRTLLIVAEREAEARERARIEANVRHALAALNDRLGFLESRAFPAIPKDGGQHVDG